jgi:predicted transcriptional regulator
VLKQIADAPREKILKGKKRLDTFVSEFMESRSCTCELSTKQCEILVELYIKISAKAFSVAHLLDYIKRHYSVSYSATTIKDFLQRVAMTGVPV